MRFTQETRFPHPVLGQDSDDFVSGDFDVVFTVTEDGATGALSLSHEVSLTEPGIRALVESGQAAVGCFVKCEDTYFTQLARLSWPTGRTDFQAGLLLNRVTFRPLIWMCEDLTNWDPGTIHPEFTPPVSLSPGDIIALGEESLISVGQAKLAPIESIFELDRSPDVPEGRFRVELEGDRITILTGPSTYEIIRLLREQRTGRPVVLNSVYLPAVMEVLHALHEGDGQYEAQRWYRPFIAKCDASGIDPQRMQSALDSAQVLLEGPVGALSQLVEESTE